MQQTMNCKPNIVLSIALLASDRRDTIKRCLESLSAIREAVTSELIILDTGCSKEVRQILEQYADKIENFTWCNDFSKARNVTLQMAEGEWFLYLDDDEWFMETQDLIDFFQSGEYQQYTSASYIQRNYLDMEGSQYTDTRVGRMARITPELRFRSRIHEYLEPTGSVHKNLMAYVDHYGYVYATEKQKLAHFKRNQTLLEAMIREEPECLRWRLQLLQEYRSIDDYVQMERLGVDGMIRIHNSATPDDEEARAYIGSFYAARILAAEGHMDYERVYELCQEAAEDSRNTKLCQTFLEEMRAKACFFLGLRSQDEAYAREQYLLSEQYAQAYLEGKEYFALHQEEFSSQQIAPFVGECLDVVKLKEIYSIRICNGLKLKQVQNLDRYIDELHWNEQHVYVFEEIAAILIESMNGFAKRYESEAIPENEEFLAYGKTLKIMQKQHALWEYFCGEIGKRQDQGEDMNGIIRLIGTIFPDEVEKKESTNELERLASQVIDQIQLLIASGMREEARTVIQQVKKIIPQDPQLQELEQLCGIDGDRNE